MNIYAISSITFLIIAALNIVLGGLTITTNPQQSFIMALSSVGFLIIGIIIANIASKKYHIDSQSFGDVIRE